MSKIIPAIDEDMGEDGRPQFDLEYRPKGQRHRRWKLGGAGPLTVYRGKLARRSIEEAKKTTLEDETTYYPGKVPEVPDLEFRVVEKVFVVKRRLVSRKEMQCLL